MSALHICGGGWLPATRIPSSRGMVQGVKRNGIVGQSTSAAALQSACIAQARKHVQRWIYVPERFTAALLFQVFHHVFDGLTAADQLIAQGICKVVNRHFMVSSLSALPALGFTHVERAVDKYGMALALAYFPRKPENDTVNTESALSSIARRSTTLIAPLRRKSRIAVSRATARKPSRSSRTSRVQSGASE